MSSDKSKGETEETVISDVTERVVGLDFVSFYFSTCYFSIYNSDFHLEPNPVLFSFGKGNEGCNRLQFC